MKKLLILIPLILVLSACSLSPQEKEFSVADYKNTCSAEVRLNEEEQHNEVVLICPEFEQVVSKGGVVNPEELEDKSKFFLSDPELYFDEFIIYKKGGYGLTVFRLYDIKKKEFSSFVKPELYGFSKNGDFFYACSKDVVSRSNYCRIYSKDNIKRPILERRLYINSFSFDEKKGVLTINYNQPGETELKVEKIKLKDLK